MVCKGVMWGETVSRFEPDQARLELTRTYYTGEDYLKLLKPHLLHAEITGMQQHIWFILYSEPDQGLVHAR